MASILCVAKLTPLRKKKGVEGALDPFVNVLDRGDTEARG